MQHSRHRCSNSGTGRSGRRRRSTPGRRPRTRPANEASPAADDRDRPRTRVVPGTIGPCSSPYARLAIGAFLLYGIGYLVPLLRRDLGISESTAGLHASAVAVGTLVAGVGGERYVRRLGMVLAPRIAMLAIGLAGVVVAFAPNVALTLAGAVLFGLAGGILLSWVNHSLSSLGGQRASVALARVNLSGSWRRWSPRSPSRPWKGSVSTADSGCCCRCRSS